MAMDNEQFFAALWTHAMQDAIDWQEAAEFEERVSAKLASWEQNLILPCLETAVCERHPQDCPWCRLKYARLQVEEEMGDG